MMVDGSKPKKEPLEVKARPDVREVHAAVISAKYVGGAHRKGGVKAPVLAGRNKHVINVTVAGISGRFGRAVHNGLNVAIYQWSC